MVILRTLRFQKVPLSFCSFEKKTTDIFLIFLPKLLKKKSHQAALQQSPKNTHGQEVKGLPLSMNFQNPTFGWKKMRPKPPPNLFFWVPQKFSTLQSLKKLLSPKSLTLHPSHSKCPKPIHWTVQLPSSLSLVELHHVGYPSQHGLRLLEGRRRSGTQSWLSRQGGPAGTTLTRTSMAVCVVRDASRTGPKWRKPTTVTPNKKNLRSQKKVLRKIAVKDDDGQAHGEKTGLVVKLYFMFRKGNIWAN